MECEHVSPHLYYIPFFLPEEMILATLVPREETIKKHHELYQLALNFNKFVSFVPLVSQEV